MSAFDPLQILAGRGKTLKNEAGGENSMFLLVTALVIVPIPADARHDVDCFEATSWALSWMGNPTQDQAVQNVRDISYYYLGRLTVRSANIDWIMSASRDMNIKPRPSEEAYSARLSQCGDEMAKQLLTPTTKDALKKLPPDPLH